uniref:C-type lectin domain-containing protein n=1 Tax=Latimeria chalumnae TaxID=7897 RepID=H3AWJ9_LATCH
WECCPKDWRLFKGSCYFFSSDSKDWQSSRDNCISMESDLVVITNKEEQDFVKNRTNGWYWIGLTDQRKEDEWIWVDGTSYNTSVHFWAPGEPNNRNGNEGCVQINPSKEKNDMLWNDNNCSYEFKRICETKSLSL